MSAKKKRTKFKQIMIVIYDFALRLNLQENLLALACVVLILLSSLLLYALYYAANPQGDKCFVSKHLLQITIKKK